MPPSNINLRAAEARELIDTGRVEVVRVMKEQPSVTTPTDAAWRDAKCDLWRNKAQHTRDCCPLPAPGAVVACREPFRVDDKTDKDGAYGYTYLSTGTRWQMDYSEVDMGRMKPGALCKAPSCPTWAIRLHARVESRGAEVRSGKWCWVAGLVREEKNG